MPRSPVAGPARNAGVAASCGTFLAFTDCDCIPEPHWLEYGLEAMSECDFAGGQMTVLIEGDRPGSGAEAFELVFAFDNRRYVLEQDFTVTANLFCARAIFDKVGPFKVGVSEDKEWCLRARSLGFRIGYAANAVVAHPARRNWNELRKKWDRMTRESYLLWRDQGRGTARWMIRTWGLLPSILVHGIRIARAPELKGFRERGMAFSTLTRSRLHPVRARSCVGMAVKAGPGLMHVTICIVGFRNPEEIVACLGTLERLDYQKFDVVICENGGEAAHDQLVRALQQASLSNARILVLRAPGNSRYAGGVNHCIRSSPGSDAWWVLNPDTQPELQALSALVGRLKQGDVNAAGSLL